MFSDYQGGKAAGLEARLIRRTGEWSDGASRKDNENLEGVHTIDNLLQVVEEVSRRRHHRDNSGSDPVSGSRSGSVR